MDLLRFIAMLPVRLAGLLGRAYRAVVDFLPKVFGRVSWSAPPWVPHAAAALRRKPTRYIGGRAHLPCG